MNEESNIATVNEELNVIKYKTENIKNLIYTIRGKQVMLDSDVAKLYNCETKYVNRVVKRNIERFPEEFCFQLTENEFQVLRCQFVTLKNNGRGQHRKYMPYTFTEQGIAMLSALLKSDIAVNVRIQIMKAFIEMRNFLFYNGQIFQEINTMKNKLLEHDEKFDIVFDQLQNKKEKEFNQKIFFDGQIYDSYSLIIDIIKTAKNKILIIDNYIDDSILKMLSKKNKKVARTNKFHDRFIVIDNKELYHCGASLKDLGKRCFAISKMNDIEYIKRLDKVI
ncbi:MAG: ORF6N domain-containing protein [Clostridia bacterium]|nr:ORF6N domain-containing protein [Clostridia bacterium]